MPGFAFPPPRGLYRGSFGPQFPTPPVQGPCDPCTCGTTRCYDYLRPSRLVRFWLPTGTLGGRISLWNPSTIVMPAPGGRCLGVGCAGHP